jgi:hypothetical protein
VSGGSRGVRAGQKRVKRVKTEFLRHIYDDRCFSQLHPSTAVSGRFQLCNSPHARATHILASKAQSMSNATCRVNSEHTCNSQHGAEPTRTSHPHYARTAGVSHVLCILCASAAAHSKISARRRHLSRALLMGMDHARTSCIRDRCVAVHPARVSGIGAIEPGEGNNTITSIHPLSAAKRAAAILANSCQSTHLPSGDTNAQRRVAERRPHRPARRRAAPVGGGCAAHNTPTPSKCRHGSRRL